MGVFRRGPRAKVQLVYRLGKGRQPGAGAAAINFLHLVPFGAAPAVQHLVHRRLVGDGNLQNNGFPFAPKLKVVVGIHRQSVIQLIPQGVSPPLGLRVPVQHLGGDLQAEDILHRIGRDEGPQGLVFLRDLNQHPVVKGGKEVVAGICMLFHKGVNSAAGLLQLRRRKGGGLVLHRGGSSGIAGQQRLHRGGVGCRHPDHRIPPSGAIPHPADGAVLLLGEVLDQVGAKGIRRGGVASWLPVQVVFQPEPSQRVGPASSGRGGLPSAGGAGANGQGDAGGFPDGSLLFHGEVSLGGGNRLPRHCLYRGQEVVDLRPGGAPFQGYPIGADIRPGASGQGDHPVQGAVGYHPLDAVSGHDVAEPVGVVV